MSGGMVRLLRAALLGIGLWSGATAQAATLIVIQADGSAVVRVEDGPQIVIPQVCVEDLQARLVGQSDPALVSEAVEIVVREYTADDPSLAAAIAIYAQTLVPPELADAVIVGAQRGNPDASDEIAVASGPPVPRTGPFGSLLDVNALGGTIGGGTEEPRRGASPID